MSNQRALEIGSIAAGVPTRLPQLIVHQAASTLRQLLDRGTPATDPRCLALVQLVNSARLLLLPNSNNGAKTAKDLTASAVHIDVSTASMAAIMGLKNAGTLTGAALAQANIAKSRASTSNPSSSNLSASNSSGLKLKLLPKFSQTAFDALIHLVKTDRGLGVRAHNEAQQKSSSMAHKIQKLKAGQRHASVRKRRLAGEALPDGTSDRRDSVDVPEPAPFLGMNSAPGMSSLQHPVILPRRPSLVFGTPVPAPTPIAPRPMSHMPPPPPLPPPGTPQPEPSGFASDPPPQRPPSFSRFRSKQANQDKPEKCVQEAIASHKGVMNDTVGTPDDIMEAFLHPVNVSYKAHHDTLDNQSKIRSVLAERERIVYRLQRRRRAELAAMPLGMTEQTRRNAIIEAKQLALLDLQRVVRYRVCAEMKKMHSLAVQQGGCVPMDHLSRLFRRRDPPIYSYTDGYPRITPFDGIPQMPPRHPETVAQDSARMAQFDMSRMVSQKAQKNKEFSGRFIHHFIRFKNAVAEEKNARARVLKAFERYLLEKKRAEERKRKLERIERLRLLRSNDEQAYLNLLKDTKNERLLQLVRQTDSYLMRIGAQVEREREVQEGPSDAGANNTFVEELSEAGAVPIDAMRRRRDLYYTVTHAVLEEVRQPSIMVHGTLKSYQLEGLKWMVSLYNNNLNGILADEMGLGKTIQTISLITYLVEMKKDSGPYMIIVPLSTMGNWVRELDLWAPSLVKVVYRGDKATRRNIQHKEMAGMNFNVLLTTYEFTVKDQHILSPISWKYIIIDEGHRMKNANCKLAMTLGVKYKSRNRLLLTGTPLQNNLTELWALLNFLLPTIFSSSDTFETWFKQPFESTTLGDSAELEEEETLLVINRLHQVLRPFLLRRLKTDVESQLPQKVEHVIHCDMSSWQRVIYRQVKGRIGLATGSQNGTVKAFNNLLMQCKKICNHPYLFYAPDAIDNLPQDYLIRSSGKFYLLHHLLPKLQLHGHRTLIFSQMTAALDYLEFFLSAIGIQYLRLDGTTRSDGRQDLLNLFNAKDSPYFCFLLSTRAGGLGLNLQTADTVIIFDSDWNPMMDLQAQDRAHRIGQTKVVRVYRLICSGTVEEKILEQANRKLQVDAQVIQAGQFNNKSTEMDRHQMLKDLLRQKNGDDGLGDVPSMDELNRLFARTDEEYESYVEYDRKSQEEGTFTPLFTKETELPEWVLQPDVDHKTAEEREQEILLSHGRGRRKRNITHDMDVLTDAEWFKVVEGEMTVEEAFERRKKRRERQAEGRAKGDGESEELSTGEEGKEPPQKRAKTKENSTPSDSDAQKSGAVPTRVRVRGPARQDATVGEKNGTCGESSSRKRKLLRNGDSASLEDSATVCPSRRRKRKEEALVENPVAVELDGLARSTSKRRSKKSSKRRRKQDEDDVVVMCKDQTRGGGDSEERNLRPRGRVGVAVDSDREDDVRQGLKGSDTLSLPNGSGKNGYSENVATPSGKSEDEGESVTRPKVLIIPPKDPRMKESQGIKGLNGKIKDFEDDRHEMDDEVENGGRRVFVRLRRKQG